MIWSELKPILAALLVLIVASTVPIAGDEASHRDQVLHPVFPHMHGPLRDAVQQAAPALTATSHRGPVFAVGSGAMAEGLAGGLAPTIPSARLLLVGTLAGSRVVMPSSALRGRVADPPPDPPPLTSA